MCILFPDADSEIDHHEQKVSSDANKDSDA
jgi:hypothetical protein